MVFRQSLNSHLDPGAQEFRPTLPPNLQPQSIQVRESHQGQAHHSQHAHQAQAHQAQVLAHSQAPGVMAMVQQPIYYSYPYSSVMPVYGYGQAGGGGGHLAREGATRTLLLSSVPVDASEGALRRELEVYGPLRALHMERVREGLVVVHYYDLRHAQRALAEIQAQHVAHQARIAMWHRATVAGQGFGHGVGQGQGHGVIFWRGVWAQYVGAGWGGGREGENQGTLVVFNLAEEVTMGNLKEIFEAFGPVKELRETPAKRQHRFVEFFDIRDAAKALTQMNGKEIAGKRLKIEFSRPGGHAKRHPAAGILPHGGDATVPSTQNAHFTPTCFPQNRPIYPHPSPPRCVINRPERPLWQNTGPPVSCGSGFPSRSGGFRPVSRRNGAASAFSSGGSAKFTAGSSSSRSGFRTGDNNNFNMGKRGRGDGSSFGVQGGATTTTERHHHGPKFLGGGRGAAQAKGESRFRFDEATAESNSSDARTTLMIKNIPNKYSQKLLLNMLDQHCINCNENATGDEPLSAYDFVYLPIDFKNKCNVGYGFVNFTSPKATWKLYKAFNEQRWEAFNSRKICQVTYARLQGLEALKEHFRNSKFACDIDEYLPVVFSPPRDGKSLTPPLPICGHKIRRPSPPPPPSTAASSSSEEENDMGRRARDSGSCADEEEEGEAEDFLPTSEVMLSPTTSSHLVKIGEEGDSGQFGNTTTSSVVTCSPGNDQQHAPRPRSCAQVS
ncbi:protein terminal ear1 [Amborella trichopoda]|uniref:RRM domain-containing protein n=1 Tax=Amborella trichopoda TaxID=13333 RepID=W1Q0U4_AMBTC|nr:protein terminal ear1 [Amborella trichopoda]ERN13685.1 hypothetical protein AMTR_s00049p00134910 [Amborella trichopoda]|eukprot:XP_020527572.1 protein terminal ear1 [Amborella trichopoda]